MKKSGKRREEKILRDGDMTTQLLVRSRGPFDLHLSLKVMSGFSPDPVKDLSRLRIPVRIDGKPFILEARQPGKNAPVEVSSSRKADPAKLKETAEWILLTSLDLRPFYKKAENHRVLGPVIKRYHGLKPLRPSSLFQMMVIAVTEQQISLTAAYRIRTRVVEKFGEKILDRRAFPEAGELAQASVENLMGCGLSRKKSEYIRELSRRVADGSLDLDKMKKMPDEEVRRFIIALRGFGMWSADYILIRGLGRIDAVPADDLGVRTIVGKYLGGGTRMDPEEVRKALLSLKPFRGLAVFYLMAEERLTK
jgi:DNA-3-methyladenine glycosylase II